MNRNLEEKDRRGGAELFQDRYLTVRKSYYEYRKSHGLSLLKLQPVAHLLLKGRWLERAGFKIGKKIVIEVEQGRLVISVMDEERSEPP